MTGCYPSLIGKKVFITGAASGIGEATAKRFLDEGSTVFAADIDATGLETRWGQRPKENLTKIHCDVTNSTEMESIFAEIEANGNALDFVFANAGVSIRHHLRELPHADWHKVIDTNLHGVFNTVNPIIKSMYRRGSGSIVVMGSTNGLSAHPHYSDYNVSKAGVIMLARSLALEFAPIVRVNAICPGYVLTEMQKSEYTQEMLQIVDSKIPLRRHADPSEIAALVAFLASSEASYITGSVIAIDGGETA